jgi:hypothetical protein
VTKRLMLVVAFVLPLLVPVPAQAQTPNRIATVQAVAATDAGKLAMSGCKAADKRACHAFTRLAACALATDGFGLLTKNPGENNVDGYAVDAIIYKSTNQVIDLISASESASASVQWGEVPRRSGNEYAAPVGCAGPIDPPPPPPPPTSSAATADLQQQQLAALLQIVAKLETQLSQHQEQSTKLEAAIRDLKAEIAKGIKVRF